MTEQTRAKSPRASDLRQQAASQGSGGEPDGSAQELKEAVTYDREQLQARSRNLFSVNPLILAGALAAAPPSQERFTVDEVKTLVSDYNGKTFDSDEEETA